MCIRVYLLIRSLTVAARNYRRAKIGSRYGNFCALFCFPLPDGRGSELSPRRNRIAVREASTNHNVVILHAAVVGDPVSNQVFRVVRNALCTAQQTVLIHHREQKTDHVFFLNL